MKAEDVARYLAENPDFFDQYSEMLSQISVSNPHGGRAISLSDRQVLTLREKNKVLEAKLSELIQFGEAASHIRSVALMPLKDQECFGMLALGSEDVMRFYPEMGTLYLKRLGELAGASLARLL